jgi:ADP-ribosylglycohydrolase
MPIDGNKVRAVVYGQAIGDALGLPAEFKSAKAINTLWPDKAWPTTYQETRRMGSSNWKPGEWSDDTEQAICVLDAYLQGVGIGNHVSVGKDFDGKVRDPADHIDLRIVAQQFLHWAATNGRGMGNHTAKVFEHPLFTLEPTLAASDVWEQSGKKAAPNGAVMRTSYVGILRPWDLDWTTAVAEEVAATTHADPRCIASAVAVSVAIACLVNGGSPGDAFSAAVDYGMLFDTEAGRVIVDGDLASLKLDEGMDGPRGTTFPPIGYTYKCLGAGFWALRRAQKQKVTLSPQENYANTLREVIRAGGDADTNGAVAGAMLGAYLGLEGIPPHLVEGLNPKSELDRRVTQLLSVQRRALSA